MSIRTFLFVDIFVQFISFDERSRFCLRISNCGIHRQEFVRCAQLLTISLLESGLKIVTRKRGLARDDASCIKTNENVTEVNGDRECGGQAIPCTVLEESMADR